MACGELGEPGPGDPEWEDMEELIEQTATDGVVTRQALLAAGATPLQVKQAEARGALVRIWRGRYKTPGIPRPVEVAADAGGTLSCLSALRHLGVSTLDDAGPHHIRRRGARRRDGPVPDALECRSPWPVRAVVVDSLDAALVAAAVSHNDEDIIVALDSVLHQGLRTRSEIDHLFRKLPGTIRRLPSMATGLAESALESVVRYRLGRRQVRVTAQFKVPGAGRYDLLVGARLLVELDGFEYHRNRAQFRADRRRDRRATALGYTVLRFTWDDVMFDWANTLATILSFVTNDHHRGTPRPRSTSPAA